MGYLDDVVTDVCVIPAAGGEHKRLTADANMNAGISWSPDGQESSSWHCFTRIRCNPFGSQTVDLQGNVYEIVDKSWGGNSNAAGRQMGHILFTGKGHNTGWGIKQIYGRSDGVAGNRNAARTICQGRSTAVYRMICRFTCAKSSRHA